MEGQPRDLVVLGAQGGMARLLTEGILAPLRWRHVWLLDVREAVFEAATPLVAEGELVRARVVEPDSPTGPTRLVGPDGAEVALGRLAGLDAAVMMAVPQAKLPLASRWLLPLLGRRSVAFDIASEKSAALAAMGNGDPDLATFGTHPLFGHTVGTIDGQTVVVCPSLRHPDAHRWFTAAVEDAGGAVKEMAPERHDLVMAYVQTATHQALLTLAEVVASSGLDIEHDLWECRTPQFETLMAMMSRVLSPEQEETIASIQLSTAGGRVAEEVRDAHDRVHDAIAAGSLPRLRDYISQVREPFSGSLFNRMQQASNLATRAVQSPRSALAEARRAGTLVGVCPKGSPERMRVGEVVDITTTSLVLRNLLHGRRGGAVLLGRNERAARKLGVSGKPTEVELSLGKVDILLGPDLDRVLEEWLGSIEVDVRLLGPESVAGAAMARLCLDHPSVRTVELVAEEVRAGQREYVVRCAVRADHDLSGLAVELQRHSDAAYAWPERAVSRRLAGAAVGAVGYLGPAGTFSAAAAASLAESLAASAPDLVPCEDFSELLDALAADRVQLAVLPICNSATGLVEASAEALDARPDLAGRGWGIVDVEVRFDAYCRREAELRPGAEVLSQSQALRQCRRFVAVHRLVEREVASTLDAVERVAAGDGDVALAPAGLRHPGVSVVDSGIGDVPGAITRFLVLGRDGGLEGVDPQGPGADPPARAVWLLGPEASVPVPTPASRFDEVVAGASGRRLWISTDPGRIPDGPGVRSLGTFPWSPRTPIVAV